MNNIFEAKETNIAIDRINNLDVMTRPLWGKMTADQMLAHCNVVYEMTFEDIHPKPKGIKKALIKLLAKSLIVGDKPYKKNNRTAPQFLIVDARNFEAEKGRLINYLKKTQSLGADHFDGKESHSLGKLTKQEWNNMFYKHLDHHLSQFGV